MGSILGNFFGNAALDDYFTNRACWLALHQTDPGVNGDLSTEFNGGGYKRQRVHFTSPSAKTVASSDTQIFHDLPNGIIRYIAVWDASANGHCMIRLLLSTAKNIDSGGQFTSLVGDVAFSL